MDTITVAEHLESMTEVTPPPWLVELGEMLQEIDRLDSALAASIAFDLARNPAHARALHQLIQGCESMSSILSANDLTSIEADTIKKTIHKVGMTLLGLSAPNNSFQAHALYDVEKEK